MKRDDQLAAFNAHHQNAYRAVLDYLLMNYDEITNEARYRLVVGVDEFPGAPMFTEQFDHYGNMVEELADAVNYLVGFMYQNGISSPMVGEVSGS